MTQRQGRAKIVYLSPPLSTSSRRVKRRKRWRRVVFRVSVVFEAKGADRLVRVQQQDHVCQNPLRRSVQPHEIRSKRFTFLYIFKHTQSFKFPPFPPHICRSRWTAHAFCDFSYVVRVDVRSRTTSELRSSAWQISIRRGCSLEDWDRKRACRLRRLSGRFCWVAYSRELRSRRTEARHPRSELQFLFE